MSRAEGSAVSDGDRINAAEIAEAMTRAPFIYTDGNIGVHSRRAHHLHRDGEPVTRRVGSRRSRRFWSFWPPNYRAIYDVSWITDADGDVVGIRFTEVNRGATFEGRYTPGRV